MSEQTVRIKVFAGSTNISFDASLEEASNFFNWLAYDDSRPIKVINGKDRSMMLIKNKIDYAVVDDSYFVQPNDEFIVKLNQLE